MIIKNRCEPQAKTDWGEDKTLFRLQMGVHQEELQINCTLFYYYSNYYSKYITKLLLYYYNIVMRQGARTSESASEIKGGYRKGEECFVGWVRKDRLGRLKISF